MSDRDLLTIVAIAVTSYISVHLLGAFFGVIVAVLLAPVFIKQH